MLSFLLNWQVGIFHRFLIRLKPIFHLATLFGRREAETRIRQRDWLKLAGEKIRREQAGSVPNFLSVCANKVAKWKIGFRQLERTFIRKTMWILATLNFKILKKLHSNLE